MIRTGQAEWNGGLKDGAGNLKTGSGAVDKSYSFRSRFGDDTANTNPEELIAAAHAACYSMALSFALETAGYKADSVKTTAKVQLDQVEGGFAISKIELTTQGTVPGLDEETFLKHAEDAKKNCPVSKALAAVNITLNASLS